ncbi:MAG: GNAT family N-acetyltransferase [Bacteroidota bacterium]
MNWIHPDTLLEGEEVKLIPMSEEHFDELEIAAREKRIWEFIPANMSNRENCLKAFAAALTEREKQKQFPFVILHKLENRIIGSTRLMEIVPNHQKLEIGWTWLHPDYWATSINFECKLLLLTFCFEELKAIRVQLKTDENNKRSQKAIEKIGATYEGILRHDYIRANGTIRNSAYFSIIHTEWEQKKLALTIRLHNKRNERVDK